MSMDTYVVYIDISKKKKEAIKNILLFIFYFVKYILAILIAFIIIRNTFGYMKSYLFCKDYSAFTLNNCKESISPIADAHEWKDLSQTKKEEIVRTIAYIQFNYLGIPDTVSVRFSDEFPDEIGGHYRESCLNLKKEIVISNQVLEDPELTLFCLLHECYHCFQHYYVRTSRHLFPYERKLITFYKADIYYEEINNYSSYTEDSQSYHNQILEEDAYKYAEEQVKFYLERIGE